MISQNHPARPDFISFPGKIHLIETDKALARLNVGSAKELGFDTETRPSFHKGEVYKVALLQLATETDAYLIRLHYVRNFQILVDIFENEEIVKIGAAIQGDLKLLQHAFRFVPKSFVDLQHVSKAKGLKNLGLKGMTEEVLNAPLTKGPKITNWEAPSLTDRQLMYAATDAWVGLAIYRKLRETTQDVQAVPDR